MKRNPMRGLPKRKLGEAKEENADQIKELQKTN